MSEMDLVVRARFEDTGLLELAAEGFDTLMAGRFLEAKQRFDRLGVDMFVDSPRPSWEVESVAVEGSMLKVDILAHTSAFVDPTDMFRRFADLGATHVLGEIHNETGSKTSFGFEGHNAVPAAQIERLYSGGNSAEQTAPTQPAGSLYELLLSRDDGNWAQDIAAYFENRDDLDEKCEEGDGCTALHIAAMANNTAAIEWLVTHGAHIDCRDIYGRTPLHMAVSYGYQQAELMVKSEFKHVELLLRLGADATLKTANGWTASEFGEKYEDVQFDAIKDSIF